MVRVRREFERFDFLSGEGFRLPEIRMDAVVVDVAEQAVSLHLLVPVLHHDWVLQPDFVVPELFPVLIRLDPKEPKSAENGYRLVFSVGGEVAHLQGGPAQHDRDTGSNEHRGVERADGDVEQPMRPGAGVRADAQQDVGGEERAEEHDFRSEKQPDADLGVVEAGIRPGFCGKRDFHE